MKLRLLLVTGLLMVISFAASADDTDIYITPTIPDGSRPLVMLQLDFRQNLSGPGCSGSLCDTLIAEGHLSGKSSGSYTKFDVLRAILRKVLSSVSGVEIGFMMPHDDSGAGCSTGLPGPAQNTCSNGGFVGVGFGNVTDSAHLDNFLSTLDALPTPKSSTTAHWYQPRETHYEFFRYLTGQSPVNAHNGGKDHTGTGADVDTDVLTSDMSIQATGGGPYISPIVSACRQIYSINFIDAKINNDDDSNALISASKASGGMGLKPLGNADKNFAQILAYLHDNDLADGTHGSVPDYPGTQNLTSYFFASSSGLASADKWAAAGGTGKAFSLDAPPDEIVQVLSDIFDDIISTSATFVSASLPINSFNRSEVIDHAYLALFQAQADRKPTWTGNIKKLKITERDETLELIDALGAPAVATDGRIKNNVLTFWTDPAALPAPDTDSGEIANRDGRSVARGGAGQKIPGFISGSPGVSNGPGNRTLFYNTGSSLVPLNADSTTGTILQSELGAATVTDAVKLIGFTRGLDVDDLNGNGNYIEARNWIMSDPLHSKPVVINYGARNGHTLANPLIYLGAGTNDGLFHFIRSTTSTSGESGMEEWAFMPREVMGIVSTLHDNLAARPHPYGVDGAPVAYIQDLNQNGTVDAAEKVYVVFGLRRGGSAYYAMDVSDPMNPSLVWSISATGDFAEMGLTFSIPRIVHVDYGSGKKPVVIFGGGYDTNKDSHTLGSNDSVGNSIYIVDLATGNLVWKAVQGIGVAAAGEFRHPNLVDSIPSSISTIDTDGDGAIDRLVTGDTGGNVWRVDLVGSDTSAWKLTQLAALGRHSPGAVGQIDDRRFFHRPDFVQTRDELGSFDAVIIGSGDRANPLDKGGSNDNFLYMIKDRNIAIGSAIDSAHTPAALGDITSNCLQNESCAVNPNLTHGWKMKLIGQDEKMLSTPITLNGTIFATSFIPTAASALSASCTVSEGSGRLYAIALQNGTATRQGDPAYDPDYDEENPGTDGRSIELLSPGIPPEVIALSPDKILRPDLIIEDVVGKSRWKTFWYLRENLDL